MPDRARHAFGSRKNIESAISSALIDAYDILYLDNREIAWVDKDGNVVFSTSRTQEDIEGLEEVIPAGQSIDDVVKLLVQNILSLNQKFADIKTEILEEAATNASEALEARIGDIPTDTTIKAYIETVVGSGGTSSADAIEAAKQEAISTSKAYTDEQLVSALEVKEF